MRFIIPIGLGLVLVAAVSGGLLFLFILIGGSPPAAPASPQQIVATVNGVAITQEMVAKEVTISRFNVVDPLPPLTGDVFQQAAEEALNQLIARQLVLQAAGRENFRLDEATIEEQVRLLFGANGEEALANALQQADASRADLVWWVREIFTVQEFTIKVIMAGAAAEERQQVYNDWLNGQRAAATIKTYRDGQEQTLLALVGEPAPEFSLVDLAGQPVSLSDYRGKVVLVNFWATWCPSCISELPDYEQVYQRHLGATGDFAVLAINLQESPGQVQDYAAGLQLTFPVLLDADGQVTTRQYQVTGMPASFIIDRQGLVFYRHLGPMNGETLQAKLAELGL